MSFMNKKYYYDEFFFLILKLQKYFLSSKDVV